MLHELQKIIKDFQDAQGTGSKAVLASVVALDGSSYRRPGVRMLILENGKMTGAVSGGCVEKEVLLQAQSVFKDGNTKIMTYDGRYRLGCEGIIYILLEPFQPTSELITTFQQFTDARKKFSIKSYYSKTETGSMGSVFAFSEVKNFPVSQAFTTEKAFPPTVFTEVLKPAQKLIIFGTEHDAVQLCSYAAMTGWEVSIVASQTDPRTIENFPGAKNLFNYSPEEVAKLKVDQQTALLLMTHNFATDLNYLINLKNARSAYLGLLGPSKRREKLLGECMERLPELDPEFFDQIHGPAGLNIGAETPQEIAISILAEILAVIRNQTPMPLNKKEGTIHSGIKL